MSSGVLQNAVPVIWLGKSGRRRGSMRLNGFERVNRIEATVRRFQGRQGFLAPPLCAACVVR